MLPDKELIYQISLKLVPGIGDVLMKNLIAYCGSAEAVFQEKQQKLILIPGIGEVLAKSIYQFKNFDRANKEVEFIKSNNIQTHFYLNDNYPFRLKELADAPSLLFSKGNLNLNPTRMVGIVGTRKASEYGKVFTQNLVEELKNHGVQIVSGLAIGIDSIAHKSCTDKNIPNIGVLAHGLDQMYPNQHQALAKKMLECGGLLTEYPSKTQPEKENFPKRNRIVAGLCDVLVVVETAIKGGARITAELANSYNREVMAVPGRTSDYYSKGCNYLIQDHKAHMLIEPNDLIELMGWSDKNKRNNPIDLFQNLPKEEKEIAQFIRGKVKANLDEIAFELNLDPGHLSLKLLELEFLGILRSLPGKSFELN